MFSITPAGQTLIPLCSPAGVKSRHVQSLTMGLGEAYVDGNAHDLGGDVVLKDGSVLRNRCFIKNTAGMVHKDQTFENTPGASVDLELLIDQCGLQIF